MRKKLKIVLISGKYESDKNVQAKDIIKEIKKQGYQAIYINFKDLIFNNSRNEFNIFWKNKKITQFDVFILRNVFRNFKNEMCILADYLLKNNKVVVDEILGRKYLAGKVYESFLLSQKGVSVPQIIQIFQDDKTLKKIVSQKINFPLVVKPITGSKGRAIKKITSLDQLMKTNVLNEKDKYFFQQFIPNDGDLRVFVVGKKVLGAIKRKAGQNDFRNNASLGATVEAVDLTPEIRKMALEAVKATKYEVAGVDIIEDLKTGKKYVLEVNNAPEWSAFKKTTGINPAVEIVKYIVKKYYQHIQG